MAFTGSEESLVAPRVDDGHMIRLSASVFRGLDLRLLAINGAVPSCLSSSDPWTSCG